MHGKPNRHQSTTLTASDESKPPYACVRHGIGGSSNAEEHLFFVVRGWNKLKGGQ